MSGLAPLAISQPRSAILCLTNDLIIGFAFERLSNTTPDRVVVINNNYPFDGSGHAANRMGSTTHANQVNP